MLIKSLDREITIKERTRKVTRLANEALFDWVDIDVNIANKDDMDLKIPMGNIEKSNEVTVKAMTDITDAEMDLLTDSEYSKILEACTKKK